MNPLSLWETPHYFPNVCIRCGCGTGQREYFIDLGISLVGYFNPMQEGNIYYCDQCVPGLITDINREISKWNKEHSPWDSSDREEATYTWQEELEIELTGDFGTGSTDSEGDDPDSEGDSPATEQHDSDSTEPLTVPSSTVPASDEQPERSSLDIHFGKFD